MAIPDSGAPYVWTQLDASSKANLLVALKNALLASGWTLQQTVSAYVVLTFTGLPANAQTCTFDGLVYTFKTALIQGNPREVLIGATASECAANLADAINANPETSGTKYSNTTTAHPTCTASPSAGNCTVMGINGMAAAKTLNNTTLDATTFRFGGYKLDSARCPSGLQMRLILDDDNDATMIRIRAATCDEAFVSQAYRLSTATSRLLELRACKHEFDVWLLSSYTEPTCVFECGTPALDPANIPPKILSVTNSGGLIQIETDVPHGRVTGEHVYIAGATTGGGTGWSAINSDHQITVQDSTHYTLDGSTYAAEAYDPNSGLSGNSSLTSRAFWAVGSNGGTTATGSFRNSIGEYGSGFNTYNTVCWNQFAYDRFSLNSTPSLMSLKISASARSKAAVLDVGGRADLLEAKLCWPVSSALSEIRYVGRRWNCFLAMKPDAMDKMRHNFLGFNWLCLTDGSLGALGALWVATTPSV